MESPNKMQFMVDFTLPKELTDEFVALIPRQRAFINRFTENGKLLSYALALEHGKLWAVFSVDSETELLDLINELPLTPFMKVRMMELTFFNSSNPISTTFSVN
jgi:muconolactone delta-isomerase